MRGTEYFCSQKLGCSHCLTRRRSHGRVERYHAMLAATLVAPGHAMALPLMPEFIAPQDGAGKQDCERNAAKRWLSVHAARHAAREACTIRQKVAGTCLTYRYCWFNQAPLREGKEARLVDWVSLTITDAKGKITYEDAFVTSLDVTKDNVAEIVACARARWKIENESFNVLKSNGYHFEHNFGHGKQNLAMVFAALNLLAFAVHTVCDCLERLWIQARAAKRTRKRFFEHIRTITAYFVFPNWNSLIDTLITSKPPPESQTQTAS